MFTILKQLYKHKTYNINVLCKFSGHIFAHTIFKFLLGAFDHIITVVDIY